MSARNVSVIINFGEEQRKYLPRCVAAISWQLIPGDELIIENQKVFPLEPGTKAPDFKDLTFVKGLSAGRNAGAKLATCPWLKFIDADDVLAPFALNAIRKSSPELFKVVVGTQVTIRNGEYSHTIQPGRHTWNCIETRNPALTSPSFIARDAWEAVGGYDERIEFEEDWDFWLRVREKFGTRFFCVIREIIPGSFVAPICFYWIDDAERAAKVRKHTVLHEGEEIDVREYFKRRYGISPER